VFSGTFEIIGSVMLPIPVTTLGLGLARFSRGPRSRAVFAREACSRGNKESSRVLARCSRVLARCSRDSGALCLRGILGLADLAHLSSRAIDKILARFSRAPVFSRDPRTSSHGKILLARFSRGPRQMFSHDRSPRA
jgi:hypothetical protein